MTDQKNKWPYLIILALSAICLLVLSSSFRHVDFGIYYLYTKSFVLDFDFNLVNQILIEKKLYANRIVTTPTGFDSDYHPFGMAAFYAPFYLLGMLFEYFIGGNKTELLMAIGTVSYSLGAFVIIYRTLINTIENKDLLFILVISFFATPWFFYTAIEPGNANVLSLFLSAIFFNLLWSKDKNYYLLGIMIVILFACKIESVFLLIPLVFSIYDLELKSFRRPLVICFIISLLLYLTVRYIRYGNFLLGYGGVDNSFFVLDGLLFSPVHGYFFTSPVYLVAMIVSVWQFLRCRNKWSLCFFTVLTLKLFVESFSVNSGINFGARSHLIDIPLLLYALTVIAHQKKSKLWPAFLMVGCAAWTSFVLVIYKSGFRLFSLETFFSSYLFDISTYSYFLRFLNQDVSIYLIGGGVIITFFYLMLSRFNKYFITLIFLFYVGVILNSGIRSYPKRVDFRQVIANGQEGWFLKEETSNFAERLDYYLFRDKSDDFKETLDAFGRYLKIAEAQLLVGDIEPYWEIYKTYENKINRKTF